MQAAKPQIGAFLPLGGDGWSIFGSGFENLREEPSLYLRFRGIRQ